MTGAGPRRQLVHEQARDAAALPGVGHDDRDLRGVGIVGQAHVAGHADQRAARAHGALGHERHVVAAVHLGQVAELGAAEPRLGGEEAALDARLREVVEALLEQPLVIRPDRPDD